MADRLRRSFAYRSLLTDTLPYEVPVIFSNDRFHASISAPETTGPLVPAVDKLFERGGVRYTIPYNYEISKDERRTTTLSIVHPLTQLEVAEFYEMHCGGMLSHCGRGRFSLRKPIALASPFVREVVEDEEREKSGIPQLLAGAGEADMAHLSSYFVYGKYNLLSKFIASREYIRLESRYRFVRRVDISKCFYNIYTHSVTWSVKNKAFAKQQRETYSFESAFDRLMQKCNYNETNGIVVGPEFSRIFAEIILQDVDECVEAELREQKLNAAMEYDARRYVDDYFIFADNPVTLDKVESLLRRKLEGYKLYVNEDKVETQRRPFVSGLTLARDEIAETLRKVSSSLAAMKASLAEQDLKREANAIRLRLNSVRLSVSRHQIEFANISGWLMVRLRRLVRRAVAAMRDQKEAGAKASLGDVAIAALETSLYICSIDLRVRTTYSLCQIALLIERSYPSFTAEQGDLLLHLMSDHIATLIRFRKISLGDEFGQKDDVELCNLLICGAQFVGRDFLTSPVIEQAFTAMVKAKRIKYFNYITLAFCMRKATDLYVKEIETLHLKARERVLADGVDVRRDTEEYLMAVDYLSSPEVSSVDKQSFFKLAFKHSKLVSFSALAAIGQHAGFADWTGVTVEHLLRRKELRPVYAWS